MAGELALHHILGLFAKPGGQTIKFHRTFRKTT